MVRNKLDVFFQAPAVAEGEKCELVLTIRESCPNRGFEAPLPPARSRSAGGPLAASRPLPAGARRGQPPARAVSSRSSAPCGPSAANPLSLLPSPRTSSSPQAHLMQPASFQYILRVLNTNVDGRVSEYSRCRTLPCAAPLTFGAERRSRRRRWVYVVVPGEGLEGLLLPSLWCLAPEPLRRLACSVRGPPPAARRPPPAAHRPPPDVWRLLAARLSAITCTLLLRLPNAYPRLTPTALPPCSPAQRLCMR
jgi:hypothetical protein